MALILNLLIWTLILIINLIKRHIVQIVKQTSEHLDNISFACTPVNATIAEQQLDHEDVKTVSKVSKSSIIIHLQYNHCQVTLKLCLNLF